MIERYELGESGVGADGVDVGAIAVSSDSQPGGSGTSSMTRSFESGPLEGEPPLELVVAQRDRDTVVVDRTGLAHDDRHEMADANHSVSLGGPLVDRRAFADLERDSGP